MHVMTNNTSFVSRPQGLGGLGISPLDFVGNIFGGAGKAASEATAATQGSIETLVKGETDRARARASSAQVIGFGLVGGLLLLGVGGYFLFRKA